jgi:peptidoglycan/xylan/chitin deacetylase (PgdA/CDA1 family)
MLNGRDGAGYYEYWHYTHYGQTQSHFINRLETARDYVEVAESAVEDRVDLWFDPSAQAVVILTFDTEGSVDDTRRVHEELVENDVPATFYMTGSTLRSVRGSPTWQSYLSNYDLQNHTDRHPGNGDYSYPSGDAALLNTFAADRIRDEIDFCAFELATTFGVDGTSFRAPWCDGHKSFDMGVARILMDAGIKSDSSITTVANVAAANNWVPPAGMRNMSLHDHPFPFLIQDGSRYLVEFPFSYPSDWQAPTRPTNLTMGRPPNTTDRTYLMNAWLAILDEIRARRGVMVVLMHPATQAHPNNGSGDGLDYLIERMKTRSGVHFSTITEATERYLAYRGLP